MAPVNEAALFVYFSCCDGRRSARNSSVRRSLSTLARPVVCRCTVPNMRRSLQQQSQRIGQLSAIGTRSRTFAGSARHLKAPQAPGRPGKVLSLETINPAVLNVQYAVRGAIPQEADKLERKLKAGGDSAKKELGFPQVIYANIGKCVLLLRTRLTEAECELI